MQGWEVLDSESLSLHKYISFTLQVTLPRRPVEDRKSTGWRTRSLNVELMAAALAITPLAPHHQSADIEAENLVTWIAQAADKCVPRRKVFLGKHLVPWWSRELGLLRGECNKARRIHQRSRKRLGEDRSRVLL